MEIAIISHNHHSGPEKEKINRTLADVFQDA
jgi:hypothetical protein